jgi:hypothetical protein
MKTCKALMMVMVLTLACSLAFAQHGRSGGAGGAASPAGMGSTMSPERGAPSTSTGDRGMSGDHANAPASPRVDGKQSPDDVLSKNTKLSSNLDKLLPEGMTAQQACSGFKNLGQCVAAIHVSHNLDIPFNDLKSKVTGGDDLGKAIQGLKPDADAKAETKKAKKQADADLSQTAS